ncbi:MAG: LysM peptidoglycan-binding domain-containing protein [Candidatus Promineifilaceae bacterium]|nr:LysM peptidoglycan-binding domain-containing protein [Candidatus Promineifilaceae bacterium]
MKRLQKTLLLLLPALLLLPVLAACERPQPDVEVVVTPVSLPTALQERSLPTYAGTPTPDPPREREGATSDALQVHVVVAGETLAQLALQYGTTVEELMAVNGLSNSDLLYVGQTLSVPATARTVSPNFKIIPDSELVYGPAARDVDVRALASYYNAYLLNHEEMVEGQAVAGPEIVQLVADRYSVNPRLLLAALEYRSGWLTEAAPAATEYPMGKVQDGLEGLYKQLGWAADRLNLGYYGRAEGGVSSFVVGDTQVAYAPELNDGTAGVQYWLGAHTDATYQRWLEETGPGGFFAAYSRLFGNPFAYTVDPLWPDDLEQPPLTLPWASGETWYFTGGPHGGWAPSSAWAALDFVPHHQQLGCYPSDAWTRSMAPGVVTRSDFGAVVVDLDGDGYAGTGWAIVYMHLESRDRIAAGTRVETGDPLGHPSCEGGYSNGTHVHIARTYNGRWVSADGAIPFNMDGWESRGMGSEYNGLLVRGDEVREACACRNERNALRAD